MLRNINTQSTVDSTVTWMKCNKAQQYCITVMFKVQSHTQEQKGSFSKLPKSQHNQLKNSHWQEWLAKTHCNNCFTVPLLTCQPHSKPHPNVKEWPLSGFYHRNPQQRSEHLKVANWNWSPQNSIARKEK